MSDGIQPMLCHRFRTHANRISWPCFVQPKLNGVRAIYYSDGDRWQSHSRQTKEIQFWSSHILAHLTDQLTGLFGVPVILDGELYKHGWPLQRINGAVSVNRRDPSPDTHQIEYWIFDVIADVPFTDRYHALQALSGVYPCVVPTHHIATPKAADHYYSIWRRDKFEGMVYRNPNCTYGFRERCGNKENRWPYIIKRKERSSAEFEIIGVEEECDGEGNPKGRCGALRLVCDNGQIFTAGSGLTDQQKSDYWQDPPVGFLATIQFEMYSTDGVPLQPIVDLVFNE